MTKAQMLDQYLKIYLARNEYERQLDDIKKKLLPKITKPVEYNGFTVKKVTRPVFSEVSLETARKYDAIKEAVDTKVLKDFMLRGVNVKGVRFTEFLQVNQPA